MKTSYRTDIAPDGSKIETYRIRENGDSRYFDSTGRPYTKGELEDLAARNSVHNYHPFEPKDAIASIKVEVSHPRRKEVETYQYQYLEEALDHHERLVNDISLAYTTGTEIKQDDRGRFDSIEDSED